MIDLDVLLKEIQDTCEIVHETLELYPGEDIEPEKVTCWIIEDERIKTKLMSIDIDPIEGNIYDMYLIIGKFHHIQHVFAEDTPPDDR